ncbi:MAG TPA: alkaline phosphatase family protein [Candidatus Tumulicola sp.]
MLLRVTLAALWLLPAVSGCGARSGPSLPPAAETAARAVSPGGIVSPIQHVVIIFQENRTPDNLFQGVPGADIAQYGVDSQNQQIALVPQSMRTVWDLGHNRTSFIADYNGGKMNGWDSRLPWSRHQRPYSYVPKHEAQPYLDMATQYVFGDRMFETQEAGSFPAHQYLVSGSASALPDTADEVDSNGYNSKSGKADGEVGCDATPASYVETIDIHSGSAGPNEFPCFERVSLPDLLDAKQLTWRYYQHNLGPGNWHAFDAVKEIRYGNDYQNVVTPSQTILTDIASGNLTNVSWVIPPSNPFSDHPGNSSAKGPSWVAAVVNAIGHSQYWNSTAIFVTWDDWGGWYDHVKPPFYNHYQLGFRVPLLVVSPYAKRGYVSHKTHEFASMLKFVEKTFALGTMGTTDLRADDIYDAFDFKQQARTFSTIKAPPFVPSSDTVTGVPDEEDPDN